MTRLLLSFIVILATTVAAWSADRGFNNLRGSMTCLKSIAYRAGCPATSDDICASLWHASVKFCNDHRTTNRVTYLVALQGWQFLKIVEQDRRGSHWQCGESDRLAELARQAEMERNDPNAR